MQTYEIKEAVPGPIISNICHQLEVRKTIIEVVPSNPKKCLLDPGTNVIDLIIKHLRASLRPDVAKVPPLVSKGIQSHTMFIMNF
jgi:hypothetical protein